MGFLASPAIPVPRSPQGAGGDGMSLCSEPGQGLLNSGGPAPPEEEAWQPPGPARCLPAGGTKRVPHFEMTQINDAFVI